MTNLKLTHRAWKEFPFSDIFTKIQRGKRLTKSNQIEGEIPYVSSTATNNGVDNFIDNTDNVRMFNNCLSLANSGSVGSVFYHHYTFVGSDHITALELDKPNKYIYLFLSGVIKRLEEKYSFNREINDVRIKREKILLPVKMSVGGGYEGLYTRLAIYGSLYQTTRTTQNTRANGTL